jgi:hypothetical protein
MNTADNVNQAARHLIIVHGNAAENIALGHVDTYRSHRTIAASVMTAR